jgi:hypothetical protein
LQRSASHCGAVQHKLVQQVAAAREPTGRGASEQARGWITVLQRRSASY